MTTKEREGYLDIDRESVMRDLDEKGYAVIPNVCSAHDCDTYISQYRNWLSEFGDERPSRNHNIIMGYNTGNLETTWKARLSAKPAFATIWETEKLLTSIDRVSISHPPESFGNDDLNVVGNWSKAEGNANFNTGGNWFHVDHAVNRIGLHGYQGGLHLEEATESDYCFRVMQGSHRYMKDFYDKFGRPKPNHYSEEKIAWFRDRGCIPTKVPVPKGGMVVWDTRTAHDNCKPERGRPHSGRWRCVVFVSMTPARWARPKDMEDKKKIYRDVRMTGHWSSQGIGIVEDDTPEHSNKINVPLTLPEVAKTKEARLLAGDLEYDFNDGKPNGPDWTPVWEE